MEQSVSIIICTHGRCREFRSTLTSLQKVIVPDGWSVELLVIENGSKDETESILRSFTFERLRVNYLYEPNKGKSRALNQGLTAAKGDILVFADDDIRFPSEWLVNMCAPINSGSFSAVAGGITLPQHLMRPWMTPYHLSWLGSTDYLSKQNPSEMAGGNMAIHRKVLEKVSGYDHELGGGGLGNCEDSLFGRQVCAAGFEIFPAFQTPVEHHFSAAKLLYANWIKAAHSSGRSRAYLTHHFYHQRIWLPRLKAFYYSAKLHLRKLFSKSFSQDAEGIPPWELSYVQSIAMCLHFIEERKRPRNYSKLGFRKQKPATEFMTKCRG